MLGFLFFQGTGDDDDTVPESVVELCVSLLVEFSFVPFESLHTAVSKNPNCQHSKRADSCGMWVS